MAWRGLIIVTILLGAIVAFIANDVGARLSISGPVDVLEGEYLGVGVGASEAEAVSALTLRFGEPVIIIPEPAPRFRIRPYETYAFQDTAPWAAVISLDVREGYVFRIRANYLGLTG